jgi:hypothetical protein
MLAYVFWHRRSPGVEPLEYERKLRLFHQGLGRTQVPGLVGSASFSLAGVDWMPQGGVYVDWYLLKDYCALGVLNSQAVSGEMRELHDQVAKDSLEGKGTILELRGGRPSVEVEVENWISKPRGVRYEDFLSSLPSFRALWRRILALGPCPEFLVLGDYAGEALRMKRLTRIYP